MSEEKIKLISVKLYTEYYKNNIKDRYIRNYSDNAVIDNDVLKAGYGEYVYITTLDKHNKLQQENQKLKKQLEEWNHHLKCSKEMLDIQGHNGNYNYDSYMLGIYNGMEYIIALFETREPIFKSGKDIEFISNLQQENKQLKDNWNKLKEIAKSQSDFKLKIRNKKLWFEVDELLSKMQELEGSNINE